MTTIGSNLVPRSFKSGIAVVDTRSGKLYSGEAEGSSGGSMTPGREHAITDGADAYASVRTAMSDAVGLLNVAAAAAQAIMRAMSAWEVSIILLDGDDYWDIVDVSIDPSRGTRFPSYRTPLTTFPIGTSKLLSGQGYTSGEAAQEVLVEYERKWPEIPLGSIMTAPIIALGGVHGEVFLVRDTETPPFTRDELDIVSECATLLGARLPALIAAYREPGSTGGEPGTMAGLTDSLDALLDDRPDD